MRRLTIGLLLALAAAAPARAQTDATRVMDGEWHYVIVPYMWFSGIKGDVSVRGLPPIPIEKSFSDVISDFDIGLLTYFEARKDRFGLGVDVMYLNLEAPVQGPLAEQLGIEADARLLMLEGYGYYRAVQGGSADNPFYLDLLAGARYFGTSARLENDAFGTGKKTINWLDAMAGARFRVPLGGRLSVMGQGDVATLGSQFTWSVAGDVAARVSQHWTLGLGWRHLDIDYDQGPELDPSVLDIALDGPRLLIAYAW